MVIFSKIKGVGSYAPARILTNKDLEKMVDTSDDWITERTGIKERHIAGDDENDYTMAVEAAKVAMKQSGLNGNDIDLIVYATNTNYQNKEFPSHGCYIQQAIGNKNAPFFTLQAGCTGFAYGMVLADNLIRHGVHRNVLLVGADKLSQVTDYTDRDTCVLFGDGGGAIVLGQSDVPGIIANHWGADGAGAQHIILKDKIDSTSDEKLQLNVDQKPYYYSKAYLAMNGKEVFKFARNAIASTINELVKQSGISLSSIDWIIPHQANSRIIDAAASKLNFPKEKFYVNIDKYGNTSVASMPIALKEGLDNGTIKPGHKIVMVAFGAGLTYSGSLMII